MPTIVELTDAAMVSGTWPNTTYFHNSKPPAGDTWLQTENLPPASGKLFQGGRFCLDFSGQPDGFSPSVVRPRFQGPSHSGLHFSFNVFEASFSAPFIGELAFMFLISANNASASAPSGGSIGISSGSVK
jgi:hypothetical protein